MNRCYPVEKSGKLSYNKVHVVIVLSKEMNRTKQRFYYKIENECCDDISKQFEFIFNVFI